VNRRIKKSVISDKDGGVHAGLQLASLCDRGAGQSVCGSGHSAAHQTRQGGPRAQTTKTATDDRQRSTVKAGSPTGTR